MKIPTLPDGHRVKREQRQWAKDVVRTHDPERLLGTRRGALGRVLAFSHSLRLQLRNVLLVECGAHQQDPSLEEEAAFNAAISHFMALHAQDMGVDYRAFDTDYSPAKLDANFADARHLDIPVQPQFLHSPEAAARLAAAVKQISIDSYGELRRVVRANGKVPLLFSNHVLSDPALEDSAPFWRLPGLHHHSVSFMEICEMLNVDCDEEELPELGDDVDDMAMIRHVMRQMQGGDDAHRQAFLARFGLPATTDIRWKASTDGSIRYTWSSQSS